MQQAVADPMRKRDASWERGRSQLGIGPETDMRMH